jgi:hypothetical protein
MTTRLRATTRSKYAESLDGEGSRYLLRLHWKVCALALPWLRVKTKNHCFLPRALHRSRISRCNRHLTVKLPNAVIQILYLALAHHIGHTCTLSRRAIYMSRSPWIRHLQNHVYLRLLMALQIIARSLAWRVQVPRQAQSTYFCHDQRTLKATTQAVSVTIFEHVRNLPNHPTSSKTAQPN